MKAVRGGKPLAEPLRNGLDPLPGQRIIGADSPASNLPMSKTFHLCMAGNASVRRLADYSGIDSATVGRAVAGIARESNKMPAAQWLRRK